MGNTTLDPVIAGDVYRCNVIAINDNGTDSRSINDIVIIEGMIIIEWVLLLIMLYWL